MSAGRHQDPVAVRVFAYRGCHQRVAEPLARRQQIEMERCLWSGRQGGKHVARHALVCAALKDHHRQVAADHALRSVPHQLLCAFLHTTA